MDSTSINEPTWPQLLGSNNWEGLLDPLDLSLRQLILRCGDFCQATYDAFNNDQNSKYCGSSRYGKLNFFHKLMLPSASQYQVSTFLYATAKVGYHEALLLHSLSRESWDRESNWYGYVAVTTDEASRSLGRREIYVALRGTTRNYEWINVFGAKLQSTKILLSPPEKTVSGTSESIRSQVLLPSNKTSKNREDDSSTSSDSDEDEDKNKNMPKVMQGWLSIYTSEDPNSPYTKLSARTQLKTKIKELLERYKDEKPSITFTGHSLGASLSVLAAFDLVESGVVDGHTPVSAFVFGCPQVGNKAFNERLKQLSNVKVLHIRNEIDLIPRYPSELLGYVDSGINLMIDTRKSPSLKDSKNPSDWHNLQAMLHVVAGWNVGDGEFGLKVERSVALVNKSCEFLKEEYLIPGSWWVEKNRGMVCQNGEWVLAPPDDEDLPVPEY